MTSPPRLRCSAGDMSGPRRRTALLVVGNVLLTLVGIFGTIGCPLALKFEFTGLVAPTNQRLRGMYTAALGAIVAAGLLLPACLKRLLANGRYRATRTPVTFASKKGVSSQHWSDGGLCILRF